MNKNLLFIVLFVGTTQGFGDVGDESHLPIDQRPLDLLNTLRGLDYQHDTIRQGQMHNNINLDDVPLAVDAPSRAKTVDEQIVRLDKDANDVSPQEHGYSVDKKQQNSENSGRLDHTKKDTGTNRQKRSAVQNAEYSPNIAVEKRDVANELTHLVDYAEALDADKNRRRRSDYEYYEEVDYEEDDDDDNFKRRRRNDDDEALDYDDVDVDGRLKRSSDYEYYEEDYEEDDEGDFRRKRAASDYDYYEEIDYEEDDEDRRRKKRETDRHHSSRSKTAQEENRQRRNSLGGFVADYDYDYGPYDDDYIDVGGLPQPQPIPIQTMYVPQGQQGMYPQQQRQPIPQRPPPPRGMYPPPQRPPRPQGMYPQPPRSPQLRPRQPMGMVNPGINPYAMPPPSLPQPGPKKASEDTSDTKLEIRRLSEFLADALVELIARKEEQDAADAADRSADESKESHKTKSEEKAAAGGEHKADSKAAEPSADSKKASSTADSKKAPPKKG